MQFTLSHFIFLISNLILSSYLHLGLRCDLQCSSTPSEMLYVVTGMSSRFSKASVIHEQVPPAVVWPHSSNRQVSLTCSVQYMMTFIIEGSVCFMCHWIREESGEVK